MLQKNKKEKILQNNEKRSIKAIRQKCCDKEKIFKFSCKEGEK